MDALLVIDVQNGMFADPANQPHDGAAVVARIAGLIAQARTSGKPAIFIQHDGGPGDPLARGGPGFDFRPELTPLADEPVIIKRFCSGFQETGLGDLLAARGIKTIGICGMQTEYCIDTTCRAAFERGFAVILIGDAHTTFDSAAMPAAGIIRHHNATLGAAFAKVVETSAAPFAG